MAVQIILKNSAVRDRNPTAAQLADGEIALNFHESGPYLSARDRTGDVWSIAGVAVGDNAPGSPNEGRFWYSTATNTLNVFADGAWRGVGGGGGGGGGAVDQVIGGAGLSVTPGAGTGVVTINVNQGNGIEIDGDTVAVELAGDQDGLEFDGGALRVSIATADQIGGIRVGANLAIDGDGILSATGGGGGGATDLSIANRTTTTLDINSSTGDDATVPAATTDLAGLLTAADKTNLDNLVAANGTDLAIDNRGANTLDITSSTGDDVTVPAATDALAGLMTAAQVQQLEVAAAGLSFQGEVDLTSPNVPVDPDVGDLFVHTGGAGAASAQWGANSTLTAGDPVNTGDLVAWNDTTFVYIPTGGVDVPTDLGTAFEANALVVTSSTGDNATLPRATEDNDGTFREPDNDAADTTVQFVRQSANVGGVQTHTWEAAAAAAAQNLGYTAAVNQGTVTIDQGGNNAIIPLADDTNAGLITADQRTAIENIPEPGEVPSGGTDDRPAGPNVGDLYYDTEVDALLYWDGDTWRQVSNTAVGGDFLRLTGGRMTGAITAEVRELTVNAFNLATGNYWECAGGFQVPVPTNMRAGQSGLIRFVASPTGWAGTESDPFAFPGGDILTPGAMSVVPYYVRENNQILIGWPTNEVGDDDAATGATVTVTTTSFTDGNEIADRFVFNAAGCSEDNDSPQLSWSIADLPAGRSVATWRVVCFDTSTTPDFIHWNVRDIPAAQTSIAENADWTGGISKPDEIRQTDFEPGNPSRSNGWAGPCPPAGENHTYNIIVTAVLDNGATVQSNTLVFTKDA